MCDKAGFRTNCECDEHDGQNAMHVQVPENWPYGGVKNDVGKVRWDLMPWSELEQVAKVMTHGSKKYTDDNWKKVEPRRYVAAALRHFIDWVKGEAYDKDSGQHHLAHAICCLLFLIYFEDK